MRVETHNKIKFCKIHSLGNDFLVFDSLTQSVDISKLNVKKISDRRLGVGFDQLLFIEPPHDPDIDFHLRIFNQDGTEVFQCGNGLRCVGYYLFFKKLSFKKSNNISIGGSHYLVSCDRSSRSTVNLGFPVWEPERIPLVSSEFKKTYLLQMEDKSTVMFSALSFGNPHCVIVVNSVQNDFSNYIGEQVNNNSKFPSGVNVCFMEILDRRNIKLRFYERGVGETYSCGSGSCAAVAVGSLLELVDDSVQVHLHHGYMRVTHKNGYLLSGPVQVVFSGYLYIKKDQ